MTSTKKHLFSTFDVTRQVFFTSKLSLAIVNLKPLIPGHVLVIPRRVVPRLVDLGSEEVSDLFTSVQTIGKILEKTFQAQALTISIQDGAVAGQSVPHIHVHLIPRQSTDFNGNNDEIYPALESAEQTLGKDLENGANVSRVQSWQRGSPVASHREEGGAEGGGWTNLRDIIPKDEDRRARTEEEMQEEARWLRVAMIDAGVTMCED
ncbi:HIT-like domain-containing protein [Kockovaella imperatae]|uniref:HIT-like domain-containing protein n=1 Tax=Kockovaella imperatae TaxID=4999 RepID=A0A1Y1UE76_9TREE|nr:HIT-like domain-containing protein [Kockovaella imperatae]ORX36338.1 HIT-like domain-containing protein [Kockovaella imperatae]